MPSKGDGTSAAKGSRDREYFSIRTGRRAAPSGFALPEFKRLFVDAYKRLHGERIFTEWFGEFDEDFLEFFPGRAGNDVSLYVFRKLRKDGLWPIEKSFARYDEDDLFDLVEFLHDHSSLMRYVGALDDDDVETRYDEAAGRARFREVMNDVLADLGDGFKISDSGEILSLGDKDMRPLLRQPLPTGDAEGVEALVEDAKRKFLRRGSSESERLDAVNGLAAILEGLRPKAEILLDRQDEADLFHLANKFGIRHRRADQKTNYDKTIWLSWMFHYYLGTIHALIRLIEKARPAQDEK